MPTPTQRLADLGLSLPPVPPALGSYLQVRRSGRLLHLAGGLSLSDTEAITGQVPTDLTLDQARHGARLALLNRLAVLQDSLGSLDQITQIISLTGYVNSPAHFTEHPTIIDGASELLLELFGERGRHARVALGVSSLPKNAAVEISLIAEA